MLFLNSKNNLNIVNYNVKRYLEQCIATVCNSFLDIPFEIIIIALNKSTEDITLKKSREIYHQLIESGYEVMLDDRNERAGVKFADADLLGIPRRLVVSERGLNKKTIELDTRDGKGKRDVPFEELIDYLEKLNS